MSTRANVQSSEAIEAVRVSLLKFVDHVADALVTLDAELRRVQEWLEHDRPRHWKTQIRLAVDHVNECRAALHRCLMFPKTLNERPSCHEEREALKRAQARQAYCEAKAERVRHWIRNLQHEVFEYEGRISQLVRLVEIDVPRAIGVLDRILLRLEEYRGVRGGSPQEMYNELSLAKEIWPDKAEEAPETDAAAPPTGEAASAAGQPAAGQPAAGQPAAGQSAAKIKES
jgi:hypothetical protein